MPQATFTLIPPCLSLLMYLDGHRVCGGGSYGGEPPRFSIPPPIMSVGGTMWSAVKAGGCVDEMSNGSGASVSVDEDDDDDESVDLVFEELDPANEDVDRGVPGRSEL